MGVSKNRGTPKSWILIGFSIINHPFWGPTPIFGNTHMHMYYIFYIYIPMIRRFLNQPYGHQRKGLWTLGQAHAAQTQEDKAWVNFVYLCHVSVMYLIVFDTWYVCLRMHVVHFLVSYVYIYIYVYTVDFLRPTPFICELFTVFVAPVYMFAPYYVHSDFPAILGLWPKVILIHPESCLKIGWWATGSLGEWS